MQGEPLVSVVIATYNMGQYLPEAVDSVLSQYWQNLEVIVIDDGSEDNTAESILRFYDDPRFRYIRTENQGQPKAKNIGLAESKGEFIAFCDADDLWHPDKLKLQMPSFTNPSVGVVYSDISYIDESGKKVNNPQHYPRYSGTITHNLAIKNFIPFGTAVFRRECVQRNGSFDESLPMGIDWDLWLRYSLNWEFEYIPKSTYTYRLWTGQMSRNYRGRYENATRILEKFLLNYPNTLPNRVIAKAWSDMYVGRAIHVAKSEKIFIEPFFDLLKAIRYHFFSKNAWRSLLKLFLGKV